MLHLLGTPDTKPVSKRAVTLPRKALFIRALLEMTPGGEISRRDLTELFWPDEESSAASQSFRQLAARVRRWNEYAGGCIFEIDRSRVFLSLANSKSDLQDLRQPRSIDAPEALDDFVSTYRGELLSGLETQLSPEAAQKLLNLRSMVDYSFVDVALSSAETIGVGKVHGALRRLSDLFPYDERVFRTLAQSMASTRAVRDLTREFQLFVTRLARDLNATPEAATVQAVESFCGTATIEPLISPTAKARNRPVRLPRVVLLPPANAAAVNAGTYAIIRSLIDDVTIGLCRARTVAMLAPETAGAIASSEVAGLARSFEADYVARTHLTFDGANSGLCLSVLLTSADDARVHYADRFKIDPASLGRGHMELADGVSSALLSAVEIQEMAQPENGLPGGPYMAYLRSVQELGSFDLKALRRARQHLRLALADAPDFVPAIAMMARTNATEWMVMAREDAELLRSAAQLATRAIEIDPRAPAGHRELGNVSMYLGDFDAGLSLYEHALELSPHNSGTHLEVADALLHAGDTRTARREIDTALDLNPVAPDPYLWTDGAIHYFQGEAEAGLRSLQRMRNTAPVSRLAAVCAAEIGDRELARKYRNSWLQMYPDFRIESWRSAIPMRSPEHVECFQAGMRKAGFH